MSENTPNATDDERKANLLEHLKKGQERMREMREAGWKPVHRNPLEQAQDKPGSMKAAIKAFCWLCEGADADPGTKFRVRDCAVGPKCPLHPHRPWQSVKGRVHVNAEGVLESTDDNTEED